MILILIFSRNCSYGEEVGRKGRDDVQNEN